MSKTDMLVSLIFFTILDVVFIGSYLIAVFLYLLFFWIFISDMCEWIIIKFNPIIVQEATNTSNVETKQGDTK